VNRGQKKKTKKKNQAKGKQKATVPLGYDDCSCRNGIPDYAQPAACSSSRPVLAATRPGVAGPSNSRGLIPVADMDPAGVWAAQYTEAGSANLGREEDDGEMPPVSLTSLI
jgi:hypothetical protein